jgi:hypothetical protein
MYDSGEVPENLSLLPSALAVQPEVAQLTEESTPHPLIAPASLLLLEASKPGAVLPEELAALVRSVDAEVESGAYEGGWGGLASATARALQGLRSGDAEVLDSVAALLEHAAAQDADDGSAWLARVGVPHLLQMVGMNGGNLGDTETAAQLLGRLLAPGSDSLDSPHAGMPGAEDAILYSRGLGLAMRLEKALGDTGLLRGVIGELEELRETSRPGLTAFHLVLFMLSVAHAALACHEWDRAALAKAREYLEETLALPSLPPFARTMVENGGCLF